MRLRALLIALLFLTGLFFGNEYVYAQGTGWEKTLERLYPGAKKEGQVVINIAARKEVAMGGEEGLAKFNERFPGIDIQLTHVSSSKMGARIISEARAGMLTLDFYIDDLVAAKKMIDRGLVASLHPTELTTTPGQHVFKFDQNLPVAQHLVSNFGYNTKMVNEGGVPKKYEDLLNPKWKGKIALDARGPWGFTHLRRVWGEEKFWRFIKGFPGQKPIWVTRCNQGTDKVVTGEALIGCMQYTNLAELKAVGAPVEFLPMDPLLVRPEVFIPLKGSPHPNAAKLVMAWLISPEGVSALDKVGAGMAVPGTRYYDALVRTGAKLYRVDQLSFENVLNLGKTRDDIAKVWGIVK